MQFRGYQGLTVWNRAVDLVERTYRLTDTLRSEAAPEILADMRRAALSIPSHLAAGYQTSSTLEYLRHVHAAQLTLGKLETRTTILERLKWAEADDLGELQSLLSHVNQLLHCLERYLTGQRDDVELEDRSPSSN